MIKEFLQRIFKSNKVEIQTVPIEEYNKAKQALEQTKAQITSLEQANETIINQNDITLAETERLEADIRVLKIKNILDATTLSHAQKEEQLQILPRSNLSVEFIEETYKPITKKNNVISTVGTKLPQKNIPDKTKDFSYYT